MKGWKVLTHDNRPPIQGGGPSPRKKEGRTMRDYIDFLPPKRPGTDWGMVIPLCLILGGAAVLFWLVTR